MITVPKYEQLFFNPDPDSVADADRVLTSGWQSGKYPIVDLQKPIPWAFRSEEERSWNFHLHAFDMVDALLTAHSQTGALRFLHPALVIGLDWASQHARKATDISVMAWYDMAVGLRAYRLAYIYQAADQAGLLSDNQRHLLWQALEDHRAELACDTTIAFHNNHGYFQAAGQIAMGRRFGATVPQMQALCDQGIERLHRMLDQQFSPEAVHKEHSPQYHLMVLETLLGLLRAGVLTDPALVTRVSAIEKSLSWFYFPSGHLVNFGDSDCLSAGLSAREAMRRWTTGAMRSVASGGLVGGVVPYGLQSFPASGYAIIRTPDPAAPEHVAQASYLAQTTAFHSRTHKHADDLSFVWYDKGQLILTDAGRYGYIGRTEIGSDAFNDGFWYADPMRMFVESTRAHNTLEFDGRNAGRKGATPYGSALTTSLETDGIFAIESRCQQFGSIAHNRILLFSPGKWLVVFDTFADSRKKPHQVKQWFHLAPGCTVAATAAGFDAVLPEAHQSLKIRSLFSNDQTTAVIEGQCDGGLQGWWSSHEAMAIPAPAFAFVAQPAVRGAFATLFSLSDTVQCDTVWSKTNASGGQAQFLWQDDAGEHRILLRHEDALSVNYTVKPPKSGSVTAKDPEMSLREADAQIAHITAAADLAQTVICFAASDYAALAAQSPGKRVFCVEADLQETHRLRKLYGQKGLPCAIVMLPPPVAEDLDGRVSGSVLASLWAPDSALHPDLIICGPQTPALWLAMILAKTSKPVVLLCHGLREKLGDIPGLWPLSAVGRIGDLEEYRLEPGCLVKSHRAFLDSVMIRAAPPIGD